MLKFIGDVNNILEIGSYDGGSSYGLHKICNKLNGITFLQTPLLTKFLSENLDVSNIIADSHNVETINWIREKNIRFDFMFIDGDHTYEGVKQDYLDYKEFLKSGGYIAFHDVLDNTHHRNQNCHVGKFWNEIKQEYPHWEFIENNSDNDWGGIGVIQI